MERRAVDGVVEQQPVVGYPGVENCLAAAVLSAMELVHLRRGPCQLVEREMTSPVISAGTV
jgi:hypothetical protein